MLALRLLCLLSSFTYNTDYYIPVDEIKRTEAAAEGGKVNGIFDCSNANGTGIMHGADMMTIMVITITKSMKIFGFWMFLITDCYSVRYHYSPPIWCFA